jgi:hypothetical protein
VPALTAEEAARDAETQTTRLECLDRYVAALSEYRRANRALYGAMLREQPTPAQRVEIARVSLKAARRRYFEACRVYAASKGEDVREKAVEESSN